MGRYHMRIWIGEGRLRMAEIVDVKKLINEYHTGICMKCGKAVAPKQKCVCQPCRNKMRIRGGTDLERYILIHHLLELVREGRA